MACHSFLPLLFTSFLLIKKIKGYERQEKYSHDDVSIPFDTQMGVNVIPENPENTIREESE